MIKKFAIFAIFTAISLNIYAQSLTTLNSAMATIHTKKPLIQDSITPYTGKDLKVGQLITTPKYSNKMIC